MSNLTTTPQQRVTLSFPTLITDCISSHVAKEYETTIANLTKSLNKGIERGVATVKTASDLDSLVQQARGIMKASHAIRMEFTRPLDNAKEKCMTQEKEYVKKLLESTNIADGLCIKRSADIKEAERQARLEAIRKQEEADAKARAKEEKNRNISLAKGGTGEVKPVIAPQIQMPVSLAAATNTTKIKYRVSELKIEKAIENGVREIPGVRIFQVWRYDIIDRKKVPHEYKTEGR